jgi:hypothetical protein
MATTMATTRFDLDAEGYTMSAYGPRVPGVEGPPDKEPKNPRNLYFDDVGLTPSQAGAIREYIAARHDVELAEFRNAHYEWRGYRPFSYSSERDMTVARSFVEGRRARALELVPSLDARCWRG